MGSVCCVAAKDHSLPNTTGGESLHRDVVCSPSWSFQWDSRGRVADEIENPSYHTSRVVSRNVSMEFKGSLSSERGNLSDGGSILENSVTPISLKSPVDDALSSDLSMSSNFSTVVKNQAESPIHNLSFSIPSVFSTPTADLSSNHDYHRHPTSTPTRWAHRSPGYPLLRQISDNQILGLKSPDNSISEGRPSFVLSTCSNEIAAGSQCGSSDGWSMRTFSELVASSQREGLSFDSECLGSGRRKLSGCSSRFSYSPSMDLRSCGACSRLLTERSAWNNQKFVANNDLSVVAVLDCGHAYHAECLETMTTEVDRYDPACPICMVGDKHLSKMFRKGLRAESEIKAKNHKISKNRVIDSYLDGGFDVFDRQKEWGGKIPKMEPSSSARSSNGKPFLRRHFSIGSKWRRSMSENDSARKKGFWARYRKD
uniref:RING-type domain-containing protein n=1 Tax=Lotus japonicus TaxID=34305 RepID=I3T2R7_LOTJA|nr:unknown [Lotus japonicus]